MVKPAKIARRTDAGSPKGSLAGLLREALQARERERAALRAEGRKVVGVLAAFAPPFALVEAAGCIPVRMLAGGSAVFEARGLRVLRNEACSLLKGVLGAAASKEGLGLDAVVVGGACDQLRRSEEIFARDLGLTTFPLAVPRVHDAPFAEEALRREFDWLGRELAAFAGAPPVRPEGLKARIAAWNRAGQALRRLDGARRRGLLGAEEAALLARIPWILAPEEIPALADRVEAILRRRAEPAAVHRLVLTGPPILAGDERALAILDGMDGARIVADVSETGWFPFTRLLRPGSDPLGALARAANRFPLGCGFKRPDDAFLQALGAAAGRSRAHGVLCKTLSFCAPWNHQVTRFRRRFGLPFLVVEGDYSEGQESRLKTRIGAFVESLGMRDGNAIPKARTGFPAGSARVESSPPESNRSPAGPRTSTLAPPVAPHGACLHPPDPAPRKITLAAWHERFRALPDELLDAFRYYRFLGATPWNAYLQPPSFFSVYGARVLKRLRFDNSLAALRLWGFLLNEGERLYRAKQAGLKVVALMGDYGGLAPLVYAFPGLVPFYPDFHYWTPFFGESRVLLDTADGEGIGENCCFVRAALGAFLKGAYFPKPDLVVAAAGAACDDLNAVAQRAQELGAPFVWTELPWRKPARPWFRFGDFEEAPGAPPFPSGAHAVLVEEFRRVAGVLAGVAGAPFDEARLAATLARVERGRRAIRRIRELAFAHAPSPLPALELMQVEFAGPSFGGDLDECVDVLEQLQATVEARAAAGVGFGSASAAPVAWATPPPDPVLLDRLEELGARLAATEFLVDQARAPLDPDRPPLDALARSFLAGSLLGSSEQRAQRLCDEAKRFGARGGVISGLFASSHCVSETRILREALSRALKGPVLTFDVPAPGAGGQGLSNPVENRLAAYVEALKGRIR